MVAITIIFSILFYTANAQGLQDIKPWHHDSLTKCFTDIVTKYLISRQDITYVGHKEDDEEYLKAIHDLNTVALMSRRSSQKMPIRHETYFISSTNFTNFTNQLQNLVKETTWNPEAYFIVLFKSLYEYQFRKIFNELLKQHVNNVIIINSTAEAQLYSYNPFDNYGCGDFYGDIINYGECSKAEKHNLFPDKYVTGLRNCTFRVAIPNWPPYTIFPSNDTDISLLSYGVEPYLLRLLSEMEYFSLNIMLQNGTETFATVTADMEADGALRLLQIDDADIILGGLLMTPSRANAFEYVYDLLPYTDEIRFVVRRAEFVASWKTFYLEFDGTVWMLILLALSLYTMIMIILLRTKDKGLIILKLLDNLLLHSFNIPYTSAVKFFLITWVWFAYLINAFYQSSLVSLTTNPAMEHQISTEESILAHKLKPCFSDLLEKYYRESIQSNNTNITVSECQGQMAEVLDKVKSSKDYYGLTLYGLYEYNIQEYFDENGNPELYLLKTPFSKVIYCMYFYKGFPLIHEIHVNALRLREMGLVEKALSDINYLQSIKHQFHGIKRNLRFVIPWHIFVFGCSVSLITFIVEVLSARN